MQTTINYNLCTVLRLRSFKCLMAPWSYTLKKVLQPDFLPAQKSPCYLMLLGNTQNKIAFAPFKMYYPPLNKNKCIEL